MQASGSRRAQHRGASAPLMNGITHVPGRAAVLAVSAADRVRGGAAAVPVAALAARLVVIARLRAIGTRRRHVVDGAGMNCIRRHFKKVNKGCLYSGPVKRRAVLIEKCTMLNMFPRHHCTAYRCGARATIDIALMASGTAEGAARAAHAVEQRAHSVSAFNKGSGRRHGRDSHGA